MIWNEYFIYDETSPTSLRWKSGEIAGTHKFKGKNKRSEVSIKRKLYYVHRVIWEMFNGPIPDGMVIDHLDRNGMNNNLQNLCLKTFKENCRNRSLSKNNNTGITGVSLTVELEKYFYYTAYWYDINGVLKKKRFSVLKHGHDAAFQMASDWRRQEIAKLNSQGAGYTDCHGT